MDPQDLAAPRLGETAECGGGETQRRTIMRDIAGHDLVQRTAGQPAIGQHGVDLRDSQWHGGDGGRTATSLQPTHRLAQQAQLVRT